MICVNNLFDSIVSPETPANCSALSVEIMQFTLNHKLYSTLPKNKQKLIIIQWEMNK